MIGGKHQFGAHSRLGFGIGRGNQSRAPLALRFPSLGGRQRPHDFPRLGGCRQGDLLTGGAIDNERAWGPEISYRGVASGFFQNIAQTLDLLSFDDEIAFAVQQQAQGGKDPAGNLVLVFDDGEHVRGLGLGINGRFMFAKLNQRTQSESDLAGV